MNLYFLNHSLSILRYLITRTRTIRLLDSTKYMIPNIFGRSCVASVSERMEKLRDRLQGNSE